MTRHPVPIITPAMRVGMEDFLHTRPFDPTAFRHPDLQAEYAVGWKAEAQDMLTCGA